ncbi:MAG: type I-D CRISPR-associated protein Cas10d/Csc3 [Nostoc sp. NMS1]|uniref:type I-D CRISPR-associated protein Cas10d/Csc3 n=1 Tax=unclassified Nostoc TaxID=2593658 RepID=UPI0025D6D7FF|nr:MULTISPECIES: type I-D CRISPR-associated protein Cas10d/Csc3 [unclassified Nostoc]MBN3909438.1 type I-D CRISPR-associated protein Cas10d/Csc3 [Nostoc sp. NMS1]MBN3994324.1 type I-D CRISPR-associated protein Cas10d/Csc3 [Nostoc sp. NMS2]
MNNVDEYPEIPDLDNYDEDEKDTPIEREILTISLFQKAIKEVPENKGDFIIISFAENVLPKLIYQLVGATAKGGQFTEDRRSEGKNVERSKHDQSLLSHLLNGLFPTYRIIQKLKSPELETNPVKRQCEEKETRLFVAAYILHDFEKFPDYPIWLKENDTDDVFKNRDWRKDPAKKSDAPNLRREYVKQKIQDLSLDIFLGEDWENCIDDIVWLSSNAGDGSDADRGLEIRGLRPRLDGRVRNILHRLLKMSDLFASLLKHPRDVESDGRNEKLPELLNDLSNGQLRFSYHALSDNRGVLTNIINNALMDVHPKQYYTQLLYLPDGVVYLASKDAPAIRTTDIPNQVVDKIKTLCSKQLTKRQTGFSRDGKGFKFADYYWLFFRANELMEVSINAAISILPDTKLASSSKRSESLQTFQTQGELPQNIDVVFGNEIQIDRLAEFGDIICRGIWGKWQERANEYQKQFPKAERKNIPDLNLTEKLAEYLGLLEEIPALRQIQSLKKTGGVPLDWYYLSAKYYQKNLGKNLAQNIELMEGMVKYTSKLIETILEDFAISDGWSDLRTYVSRVISLPTGAVVEPKPDQFLIEISRYNAAKVTGRGRENVCAISSSPYTVTEQMESATLFAPQVYSNRQILFNAQAAKRQICSIWSIEIMLRQIMMSKTNATGADFEGRKYRYLYLYPAYFFTPETNKFLQKAYNAISQTRFDAELRKHFVSKEQVANLTIYNYQKVDDLLIKQDIPPEDDKTFKISYPDDETLTFFFIGLPPGREPTDTESWIMPAWLAFVLPLVLDVKVVVSESPVPPFISGADFEETVLIDGEHQAIRSLIQKDKYRLDSILPRTSKQREFSPLNALTAAYCIHLEVNRKKDGDSDWGKLADLARDLETSPLYVFHYLNKWLRKQDKIDSVSIAKIRLYQDFYYYFDPKGDDMTKLQELTKLYRSFYRAKSKGKSPKTNAIIKPIDEAADIILKFEKSIASDEKSLTEVVASRLAKLMNNVRRKEAEGQAAYDLVNGELRYLTSEEERQAVYKFAEYFVEVIFYECFKGDRARLAGTQLNLIKDTCEYLYRVAEDEYWKNRKQNHPEDITDDYAEDAP